MSSNFPISFSGSGVSGTVDVPNGEKATVKQLRQLISEKIQFSSFKLICKGRMMKEDDWTLDKYGVKPSTKILLMKNTEQKEQENEAEKEKKIEKLERLKIAVSALSKRTDDAYEQNKYYFELEDQNGQRLVIPEADRQALIQGMTLHEKGKKCLQREDYNGALELFLLSDQSFQLVSEKYLEMIDNEAHLCLDIVWTYFLKQELKNLYDAEQWLKRAERGFVRSHGQQMERVKRLRNGFCPEKAIYVRLYLMQAVVSYHIGNISKAQRCLQSAQQFNQDLKINDEDLTSLLSMGYTLKESRRALRVCTRDIDAAVSFILTKREEKRQRLELERKEMEVKREQRKYGKTKSGQPVNINLLRALEGMGFDRWLSVEALKQSNNNQHDTMSMLTDPQRKDLLMEAVKLQRLEEAKKDPTFNPFPQELAYLESMGFDRELCRYAIISTHGDTNRALALLTSTEPTIRQSLLRYVGGNSQGIDLDHPIDSSVNTTTASAQDKESKEKKNESKDDTHKEKENIIIDETKKAKEEKRKKEDEERERKRQEEEKVEDDIYREIISEVSDGRDPDAYMDIDLDKENSAIAEYHLLIGKCLDSSKKN